MNPRVSSKRSSAVVLGLGINGLAIVRSLAEKGINVFGVYTEDSEYGRFSRFCNAIRFQALDHGEDIFLQKLVETLGNGEDKSVLYAQSDEYVMFMSRNRNLLSKFFRFLLPDHEALESLSKKIIPLLMCPKRA
jgi:predicted ATP-grasp superfamily ATP-dependent carboligase